MTIEQDDERCRERAYAMWDAAGRPDGREVEHWTLARTELDGAVTTEAASPAVHEADDAGLPDERVQPATV